MDVQEETAVLVISDLHYGKKTRTFSPDVFRDRIMDVARRVRRIKSLLRGYRFDELVVACLGDVNDGTDIYATQSHHQAITNVEQQAHELSGILEEWCRDLLEAWKRVRFVGVPGNHGRSGRMAHEAASWDIVTYRYLEYRMRGCKNVSVEYNNGDKDPFLRLQTIRGHGYLLYHGHDIRTYGQIPWYGMQLRSLRWATAIPNWRTLLMGHFHTSGKWNINNISLFCTGTLVTDDDWALRTFGWISQPLWWLIGVSDSRPCTWSYEIEVGENGDAYAGGNSADGTEPTGAGDDAGDNVGG